MCLIVMYGKGSEKNKKHNLPEFRWHIPISPFFKNRKNMVRDIAETKCVFRLNKVRISFKQDTHLVFTIRLVVFALFDIPENKMFSPS